ncbi:MAG: enoyl-CoA hydratase/isomerase family protein [Proteobacteria bacterium]|nr:enoyl-CoA hydratase/isomerase family protein [Pseudomonadota bacterium]
MLTTDIDAEGFATLTIDIPGRSMNVIDWAFNAAFGQAIAALLANDAVKGIIVASGKSSFVAGADLAIMEDFTAPGMTPAAASRRIGEIGAVMRTMETGGKPVVAAASGTALGGGLELMLAAHYRIAADNPKARFGLPEVTLGLLPGAGGTQRLPRLVGVAKALPLLVEGRALTVQDAAALGIIDEIVASDALLDAAKAALREGRVSGTARWDRKGFALPGDQPGSAAMMDLFSMTNAKALASTCGNYPAPKAILSCVFEGARLPVDKGLKVERDYFGTLVTGDVAHRMIRTLFFARQKAAKAGRVPGDGARETVRRIADAYVDEGLALVGDGVDARVVDSVARAAGMAKGPLQLAAESGLRMPAATTPQAVSTDDIRERLLIAQALDAARQFHDDEADADLLDLDAILGCGFPAWLGGPLGYVDAMGPAQFCARSAELAGRFGDRFLPPPGLAELAAAGRRFHQIA